MPAPINPYDHSASYPSFSYDGRTVLYYTWDKIKLITLTDTGWAGPVTMPAAINSRPARSACLSPDGKTIYFTGWNDARGWDIYESLWNNTLNTWGEATALDTTVNSKYLELTVQISPDGKRLYYSTNYFEHYVCGSADIWYSEWDSVRGQWGTRIHMGCDSINYWNNCGLGTGQDWHPTFTAAGNKMYFAKLIGRPYNYELFVSCKYQDGVWGKARRLNINAYADDTLIDKTRKHTGHDYCPAISPDGKTLIFAGARDQRTREYLYISHLVVDEYGDSVATNMQTPPAFDAEIEASAYPNPFRSSTEISISCERVAIREAAIYNIYGTKVKEIYVHDSSTARYHWNGSNDTGQPLPPGIYYLVMLTDHNTFTYQLIHI